MHVHVYILILLISWVPCCDESVIVEHLYFAAVSSFFYNESCPILELLTCGVCLISFNITTLQTMLENSDTKSTSQSDTDMSAKLSTAVRYLLEERHSERFSAGCSHCLDTAWIDEMDTWGASSKRSESCCASARLSRSSPRPCWKISTPSSSTRTAIPF